MRKKTSTLFTISAFGILAFAILGVAVHGGRAAVTGERSVRFCGNEGHQEFHASVKRALQDWNDQADAEDEIRHWRFLKMLPIQHQKLHKAMRQKKSCPAFSLPVVGRIEGIALPGQSGSAVPVMS